MHACRMHHSPFFQTMVDFCDSFSISAAIVYAINNIYLMETRDPQLTVNVTKKVHQGIGVANQLSSYSYRR